MSLVSEALRKARQEAAARDARSRGALPATVGASPRVRRSPWAVAVLLVVVAGVGGAALAWWAIERSREAGAQPAPTTLPVMPVRTASHGLTTPTPAPRAAAVEPVLAASPPPAAPAPAGEAAPALGTNRTDLAAEPGGGRIAPPTAGTAGERVPAPTRGEPPQAQPKGRTYVIDADLGYVKLHLDWLVFKPGGSFGHINGQEVVEGSVIDGFVVEKISPDSVTLRDRRGPLVLRTR
ncbi:MAG: hypothetical protein ACM3O7_05560 [Acidobacteriota bacterium]